MAGMPDNAGMDVNAPLPLLGGLSPAAFVRRHWQRRPLLVRGAFDARRPLVTRKQLLCLAAREEVESRLVCRQGPRQWSLAHGPLAPADLPPISQGLWTVLVQGVDLHMESARQALAQFDFLPRARLDDLMISYATDGGGVGPHVDSYDVFLLQVHGRRRWQVSPPDAQDSPALLPGLPLRILKRFRPTQEWVLEPGDMLYLPPQWGHDGVALGECMTASVGFRAPRQQPLAAELLQRLADELADEAPGLLYADAGRALTVQPGRVPASLQRFASQSLRQAMREPQRWHRALGEALTEPKPRVSLRARRPLRQGDGLRLAAGSRMLYDDARVYINGEAFDVAGRDALLLRGLADSGALSASQVQRLSAGARACLAQWVDDGWLWATSAIAP